MSSIKYNVIDSIEMNRLNIILVIEHFKKNSLGTYSLPQGNVSGSKFFVAMAFQHFGQPFTGYYVFYKYILILLFLYVQTFILVRLPFYGPVETQTIDTPNNNYSMTIGNVVY